MFKSWFMRFLNDWDWIIDVKCSIITLIDPSRPYDTTPTHPVPISVFIWYSIHLVPISTLVRYQCCARPIPIFVLFLYLFLCYFCTYFCAIPVPDIVWKFGMLLEENQGLEFCTEQRRHVDEWVRIHPTHMCGLPS
jgi:hypothetical protein